MLPLKKNVYCEHYSKPTNSLNSAGSFRVFNIDTMFNFKLTWKWILPSKRKTLGL